MTQAYSKRGFALVVALLALSVVGSVGVETLIRAQAAVSTVSFAIDDAQSEIALDGVTEAVIQWLSDPESELSAFQWPSDGFFQILNFEHADPSITIDAIDLSGRLHAARLESFAMRGLPYELQSIDANGARRLVESLGRDHLAPTLEQIAALRSAFNFDADASMSPFPPTRSASSRSSVCQWLTTRGPGNLNLHSAPPELLEAALHGLNPTAARRAVASRRRGERVDDAVASALVAERNRAATRSARSSRHVPLTTASSAYGFLITMNQSDRTQRWWLAFEPASNDSSRESWRVVERRRIDL